MDTKALFRILQDDFHFRDNHVAILRALAAHGQLTADQICGRASIPKGRVYDFLNGLVASRLVEKTFDSPARYSFGNPEDRVLRFVEEQFKAFSAKEKHLRTTSGARNATVLRDRAEYIFTLMKMLDEEGEFFIIVRHASLPYFFYEEDRGEYMRVRYELHKQREVIPVSVGNIYALMNYAYHDAFKRGKRFWYVMERETLDKFFANYEKHFGAKGLQALRARIRDRLHKYNIQAFVVEDVQPMYVTVAGDTTLLVVLEAGSLAGVAVQSAEFSQFYREFVREAVKNAQPLERFL